MRGRIESRGVHAGGCSGARAMLLSCEEMERETEELRVELENREADRAKTNLRNVRSWLSVARPRDDLEEARDKRRMALGEWLLGHPKFEEWQAAECSSMLWLYGYVFVRYLYLSSKLHILHASYVCNLTAYIAQLFGRGYPDKKRILGLQVPERLVLFAGSYNILSRLKQQAD